MMKIKFGLLVNLSERELFRNLCIVADQLGFYSLAMGDHLEWEIFECLTALSYSAAITERIRISQLVINPQLRNPSLLAKILATIDQLSRGRLEVGIGAGSSSSHSYEPYGMEVLGFVERLERLKEVLDILEGLWSSNSFDYNGKYYSLKNASIKIIPKQKPRPRIMIGGRSKEIMRIASKYEAWNFAFDLSPSKCKDYIGEFKKICEEKGIDHSTIDKCIGILFLMSDEEEKLKEGLRSLAKNLNMELSRVQKIFKFSLIGKPEHVKRTIEEFMNVGVNYFILWGKGIRDIDALNIFAKDIMVAFK